MKHPLCEYYVYTYKSGKRIYKRLFKTHSASEALAFNICFLRQSGISKDSVKYEIIRKGTRQIAKQRGLPDHSVCTMVINPWQWTKQFGPNEIDNSLNRIDKEWDKAEGKRPVDRIRFLSNIF